MDTIRKIIPAEILLNLRVGEKIQFSKINKFKLRYNFRKDINKLYKELDNITYEFFREKISFIENNKYFDIKDEDVVALGHGFSILEKDKLDEELDKVEFEKYYSLINILSVVAEDIVTTKILPDGSQKNLRALSNEVENLSKLFSNICEKKNIIRYKRIERETQSDIDVLTKYLNLIF